MKKTIIYAVIGVLMILVVGVTVKLAQQEGTDYKTEERTIGEETQETGNPASEIGENEVRLTDANFEEEIRNFDGVALVDIYLPTCGYCQKVGPVISEIAKEYGANYKIGKLDASENSVIASEFKIESVPALLFFKDGEEVDRIVGAEEKEKIVEKLLSI
ncbi:MAG: thioredoxin domain-containing protein [Patescibacteria group bacterium]|nr:thioredoxin domain-containing protein [Patescibacteria group bacterium]